MKLLIRALPWLFFSGITAAVGLIVFAPAVPQWGERQDFDPTKGTLRLNSDKSIEQTFAWEYADLDTVLFWLDPTKRAASGMLAVRVSNGQDSREATVDVATVPPSGVVVISLPKPLRARPGTAGTLAITWRARNQPLYLLWQIDGSKYPAGELSHRAGDIGFQLRYQRPPLGSFLQQWLVAAALLLAGATSAWVLRQALRQRVALASQWRIETAWAGLIGISAVIFYGAALIRHGIWLGPGDFVKDVAYLQASVAAFLAGRWPTWSHLICGGLPLLANPESNSLSLGTLLGFFISSQQALLVLLAIEAGIGAAGTYILARSFSVSRLGSGLAASIAILSATYSYRLLEGFSMTGGAIAFTPWALLGFWQSVRLGRWWGILLAGSSLGLLFLRGEVHIIVAVIFLLIIWALYFAMTQRTVRPLLALGAVASVTMLWASPKLLAYLEHSELFTSNLKPYVVHLWSTGLFDDVFLTAPDRELKVPVRYGTEEHWGNFGAYTGWLPWLLAAMGLFHRRPYRTALWGGAVMLLIVSEGTFFDVVLRPLGPLGVLLRLPTRVLSVFTVLLGIMAGRGVDMIGQRWQRSGFLVAIALVAAVTIDLARTDWRLLRSFDERIATVSRDHPQPILAAHQNAAGDPAYHPGTLLANGYVLPDLCADLNIDHPFTENRPVAAPLTTLPAQLLPNTIVLDNPPVSADILIKENFTSAWVADHGIALASPEKSIHIITPAEKYDQLRITVVSGTQRAQLVVLITLLGASGLYVLVQALRWRRYPTEG